ncbi:uncharacterized protein LOC128483028 [Spea bombifrons]|uniref:uncharacterized protein LOC128483028 n=1 Tax=Spea bombifrons TaxID=233779 RepID=UPI002349FA9F|nr:uncharacterized protein LOC128483028 [Spea bombifrons]
MASYSRYHNANFQSFVRQDYLFPEPKSRYDHIKSEVQLNRNYGDHRKSMSATVYSGEYGPKHMDHTSKPKMRPTSPTRMNKPHPPEVFLVTTLHNIPGYYNCENGTSSEKGKGNCSSARQSKGVLGGNKNTVQIFRNSSISLAAEAWMKLASGKDCEAVEKMMAFIAENRSKSEDVNVKKSHVFQMLCQCVKPDFTVPAYHWIKKAGTDETAAVLRLLWTLSTDPQTATPKAETGHPRRSEYVIHPEWRIQP